MTILNNLCPADGVSTVADPSQQQPGSRISAQSLTLYALDEDLTQLITERQDMAEHSEDTAQIDGLIAQYLEALPAKVDAVAAMLRHLESQESLARDAQEWAMLRRRRFREMRERLEACTSAVIEKQPKPKRGSRKLEGATSTLSLVGNGGHEPLEIYNEALIPDQCCDAEITMPWPDYEAVCRILEKYVMQLPKPKRVVSNKAVREALSRACWACEGTGAIPTDTPGEQTPCNACMGDGKSSVPGARLQERGAHLRIS